MRTATYLRVMLGEYDADAVHRLFIQSLVDWTDGNQYALQFMDDARAQVNYNRTLSNWISVNPIEELEGWLLTQGVQF